MDSNKVPCAWSTIMLQPSVLTVKTVFLWLKDSPFKKQQLCTQTAPVLSHHIKWKTFNTHLPKAHRQSCFSWVMNTMKSPHNLLPWNFKLRKSHVVKQQSSSRDWSRKYFALETPPGSVFRKTCVLKCVSFFIIYLENVYEMMSLSEVIFCIVLLQYFDILLYFFCTVLLKEKMSLLQICFVLYNALYNTKHLSILQCF